jgi:hypothetical protein
LLIRVADCTLPTAGCAVSAIQEPVQNLIFFIPWIYFMRLKQRNITNFSLKAFIKQRFSLYLGSKTSDAIAMIQESEAAHDRYRLKPLLYACNVQS